MSRLVLQWRFPRSSVEKQDRWKRTYLPSFNSRESAEAAMAKMQDFFPLHQFRIREREPGADDE